MATRPIQISIDEELLERIDADREARESGRSAFLRKAASFYLVEKQRREIDSQIVRAYEGAGDSMLDEITPLMESQAWPAK